jgi:hypothetical protein
MTVEIIQAIGQFIVAPICGVGALAVVLYWLYKVMW